MTDAQRRINLELLVAQQKCYDDKGKLIPKYVEEFAELCRTHHFCGYNVLKYDLKVREMQRSLQEVR